MFWLKRLSLILLCALILVVAIPFAGPQLGLAGYLKHQVPPGESVTVGPQRWLNIYRHPAVVQSTPDNQPLFVLVHGHPGTAAMMWPLAEALNAQGYPAVSYDRSGWGYSSSHPVDRPADPPHHGRDLLALLEFLDDPRAVVVGYSYGGGVAQEAVRHNPPAVACAVLVSSIGGTRPEVRPPGLLNRLLFSPLMLRWMLGTDVTTAPVFNGAAAHLFSPEPPHLQTAQRLLASLALPGVPTNWVREGRERYAEFHGFEPAAVQSHVLVVHGRADAVVPLEPTLQWAQQLPDGRIEIVEGAGHGLVATQPELLADLIISHARSCTSF